MQPQENDRSRAAWLPGILAFSVALAVYLSNGREMGTYDTEPTSLLVQALAHGDGLVLDRFAPTLREPDGRLPDYVARKHGHLVSRYPVAPALLALPLTIPQRWWLNTTEHGWNSVLLAERSHGRWMAKNSAAILAALAAGLLPGLLRQLGLSSGAFVAVIAFAFGSTFWTISSQALWQHGPAVLCLIVALRALAVPEQGWWRLVLGGVATGLMVASRSPDMIFALAILAWVVRSQRGGSLWFLGGSVPVFAALIAYNFAWFGTPLGGQAELEALHPELHGVSGPWTWNLLPGLLGTLLSPSRGLFVFMPWVVVVLALLPLALPRLRALPLVPWLLGGLVAYTVLLSAYTVWWGGFCYGPRYWTDTTPLLAILLAGVACELKGRWRLAWLPLGAGLVGAVLLQALGAWCYPSSWNLLPANIDTHHERLWDWRDTEVTRCIQEKLLLVPWSPPGR